MTGHPRFDLNVLIVSIAACTQRIPYGTLLDFEDAIARGSNADIVPVPIYSRRAILPGLLRTQRPLREATPPRRGYDLCILIAMTPWEIGSLRLVRDLRRIAARTVLYVFDSWPSEVEPFRRYRAEWRRLDRVFIAIPEALDVYRSHLECPVEHLPVAIDPRRFHPHGRARAIDVAALGRRLPAAHAELMRLAQKHDLFYYFTEVQAPVAIDLRDSQTLIGQLCRSACVQVCWPVERTNPERRGEASPITPRWFEAAACGSLVIGERPNTEAFDKFFPSPQFVREADPAKPDNFEAALLAALGDDDWPGRLQLAKHVREHHTWERRFAEILDATFSD